MQWFNARRGTRLEAVSGVITIGTICQFLRLEGNQISVDLWEYFLHEIDLILGVLALPFSVDGNQT